MIGSHLPLPLANPIAVSSSVGHQSRGEGALSQNPSHRPPSFVSVEPLAASGRQQLHGSTTDNTQPASAGGSESVVGENAGASNTQEIQEKSAEEGRQQEAREARQLELDQRTIARLAARDREVRAHEQAHAAIGGQYAGAAQFQYQTGPNGVRYAVGGEVSIDIGRESTPEATLRKAEIVLRAALAPAEPSPQDRRVAAEASRLKADAQREIAAQRTSESSQEEGGEAQTDAPNGISIPESKAASNTASVESSETHRPDTIRASDNIVSSRLSQGIANTSLNSRQPGSILDQIV